MQILISNKDFITKISEDPGVYQYLDKNNKIIYVGKAKNLRKRVSSYFRQEQLNQKTKVLVKMIFAIEYFIVDSEIDALLLENNLIKQHQPRYNILLKDDKSFPWIIITNEPFPRIFTNRKKVKDGSQYFGPYPKGRVMHTLLDLIRDLYPIRTCRLDLGPENILKKKHKVCLEYHLKRCLGPCEGLEKEKDYAIYIQNIRMLLNGKTFSLIQELKAQMKTEAENLAFEKAEIIKNNILRLEAYRSKSIIVYEGAFNADVLTFYKKDNAIYYNYLWVREGQITFGFSAMINLKLNETEEEIAPLLIQYLHNLYESKQNTILVNFSICKSIGHFQFVQPKIGIKAQMVSLSYKNAKLEALAQNNKIQKKDSKLLVQNDATSQLQKDLHLIADPIHIECFDNSNIQGTNAVAACVVFKNGIPCTKEYRHFNIKSVEGPDDFASMKEIVFRRYKRVLDEKRSLPNLIIIDGGKGQLSAAMEALHQLKIGEKIPAIGIAKRMEEIFFPGDKNSLILNRKSASLKLIQHIRNEAHRFGITHHRNKRSANFISSELEQLKGIGAKTIESLFKQFGSLNQIKNASKEELIRSIGKVRGELLFKQLQ